MVARPDAAHEPPARRKDDAVLARPLRDGARQGAAAVHGRADQPVPAARARPFPGAALGGHARSRDADLARQPRQREGASERELRARGDGAVRARPGQLHRGRRQGSRARVHRLVARQEPAGAVLSGASRRRHEDRARQDRRVQRRRRHRDRRLAAGAPAFSRAQAARVLRLQRSRARADRRRRASVRAVRVRRREDRRHDPAVERLLLAARVPRDPEVAGGAGDRDAALHRRAGGAAERDLPARAHGPGAAQPAERQGLGRRSVVDQHVDDAGAVQLRQRAGRADRAWQERRRRRPRAQRVARRHRAARGDGRGEGCRDDRRRRGAGRRHLRRARDARRVPELADADATTTQNPMPFGPENYQDKIRGALALALNLPVNQLDLWPSGTKTPPPPPHHRTLA